MKPVRSLMTAFVLLSTVVTKTHVDLIDREPQTVLKEQEMIPSPNSSVPVVKKVLANGMTILVKESHTIPKVSLQIWYNVGSKDEKTGEKGIAHLIEHMIFKGTETLSESDINDLVHKLSGTCNAFTSYDYTGYLFDLPTQNWKAILPVVADCMSNCSFKEDHLSSEMKAVIQELKMRRDNYPVTLVSELLSAIFPDHPYHYPIIGYKQDLWNVHSADLKSFYKKHYHPNNSTLVVVGDVKAQEVFDLAERYFGSISAEKNYTKDEWYWNEDIGSKSVTIYRDVQQEMGMVAYVVPGSQSKQDDVLEILHYLLGSGKTSRLYKTIVEDLQLATSLETGCWNLFEHALFFVFFEPKDPKNNDLIIKKIQEEIDAIAQSKIDTSELAQALKQAQMKYYRLVENTQQQAYEIGKFFLATGDEQYVFNMYREPIEQLKQAIITLCSTYLRSSVMHRGTLAPLPASERKEWARLQEISDAEDNKILSNHIRNSAVEPARYAHTISSTAPQPFNFPKADRLTLSNGITVLAHDNATTPKITLVMEFKAKSYYDSSEKPGLYSFMTSMMTEGTAHYNAEQFAREFESRGMSLGIYPGGLSLTLLKEDLEKGLELLVEVLAQATFPEEQIEKIRHQLVAEIKNFWDNPNQFIGLIVRENIYKKHPYGKNSLGTVESIQSITKKDLVECYKQLISHDGATLAVVGDISSYDLKKVLDKTVGQFKGNTVPTIEFPQLNPVEKTEVHFPINRDQIVLCYAGLSIDRKHPDYDKLLLFDQIFGGGVLGSMASRLFQLREQSGLFYTINGTLLAGAGEQPGMVMVKTIVSKDRLQEAERAISNTIETVIDTITQGELDQARDAVINNLVNNFESNQSIAQAFLFTHRFGLPATYFDTRAQILSGIDVTQVKEAAAKVLKPHNLLLVKVGRVASEA